jgi:hypothetical protein
VRPQRASDMYDIGLTKLFQLIKDGRLESRKVDGMRLISVVSLETLGGSHVCQRLVAARLEPSA